MNATDFSFEFDDAKYRREGDVSNLDRNGLRMPEVLWWSGGFSRSALDSFRGWSLPDLLGDHTRLLFVGINPGLRAVAVRAHFGGGGSNRFYPALYRAGIVDRRIDASAGFLPEDLAHLH
jgi:hypothetical protein